MTVEELKNAIESNTLTQDALILVCNKNSDFLAHQYINYIAKSKNLSKKIIDDVSDFVQFSMDMWGESLVPTELLIHFTDEIKACDSRLLDVKNLIVVTKKIESSAIDIFMNNAVALPELNELCIKDYMSTNAKGLSADSIDWLYKMCSSDMFRIEQEIDKFKSIDENQQQLLFDEMRGNNAYSDLTDLTIFNLTNAIQKHDCSAVSDILHNINSIDVDAFALCTILHNAFRNVLAIQCGKNVTSQMLGIKDNQFRALFYSKNKYTNKQLIDNIYYINSIDYKLKTGMIDADEILDLIITHIL